MNVTDEEIIQSIFSSPNSKKFYLDALKKIDPNSLIQILRKADENTKNIVQTQEEWDDFENECKTYVKNYDCIFFRWDTQKRGGMITRNFEFVWERLTDSVTCFLAWMMLENMAWSDGKIDCVWDILPAFDDVG